jgi:hypothetical protein
MGLLGSKPSGPPVELEQAPECGKHYLTEVNKGSLNMQRWQGHLNDMYRKGYRLLHVFEQDGNTVQVYEHHGH